MKTFTHNNKHEINTISLHLLIYFSPFLHKLIKFTIIYHLIIVIKEIQTSDVHPKKTKASASLIYHTVNIIFMTTRKRKEKEI